MNTLNTSLKEEFNLDWYMIEKSNQLQIRLAERLWISLEEFANYYSEIVRKFLDRNLKTVNPTQLTSEKLWEWTENTIYTHLLRHFFAWKVEATLSTNN